MNKKNIFLYQDYKTYLMALEQQGLYKGFRSRIAECTKCQNAFISQVFNGPVNFNLEQAMRIAEFLHFNDDEHQYFLWMIEYKRAGTQELKKYFLKLMNVLRDKNLEIKKRVQIPQVLSADAQTKYYSSWIFAAVHVAVMIPKLNSNAKIAEALNLSEKQINYAVEFLLANGLIERKDHFLKSGRIQIHLSHESTNINKHHGNWRIEALKSLDNPQKNDLHYSGVSCFSKADVDKIRSIFIDTIENYVRLIEKSPEETIYTFNLDFFRIIREE